MVNSVSRILMVGLVFGCGVVLGADAKATKDQAVTESSKTSQKLKARVISVKGTAKWKVAKDDKAKWQPVKKDDVFGDLVIVLTGFGSNVVLEFGDRGRSIIKSCSKVGIASFHKQGTHVRTRIGLKYGTVRVKVDSSKGTNDFSVETPEATLSVRGTQGECSYSGDSGTSLDSGTGTWNVSSRGQQQTVQGTQSTDSKLTDADELAMQKRSTRMGDASGGITDAERKSLNRHGGTDRIFDPHVFDHVWRTGDCSSCGNP